MQSDEAYIIKEIFQRKQKYKMHYGEVMVMFYGGHRPLKGSISSKIDSKKGLIN